MKQENLSEIHAEYKKVRKNWDNRINARLEARGFNKDERDKIYVSLSSIYSFSQVEYNLTSVERGFKTLQKDARDPRVSAKIFNKLVYNVGSNGNTIAGQLEASFAKYGIVSDYKASQEMPIKNPYDLHVECAYMVKHNQLIKHPDNEYYTYRDNTLNYVTNDDVKNVLTNFQNRLLEIWKSLDTQLTLITGYTYDDVN